jgi:hypothetical protein
MLLVGTESVWAFTNLWGPLLSRRQPSSLQPSGIWHSLARYNSANLSKESNGSIYRLYEEVKGITPYQTQGKDHLYGALNSPVQISGPKQLGTANVIHDV